MTVSHSQREGESSMSLTNEQLNRLRGLLEDELSDVRDRLDHNDSYQLDESLMDSIGELSHYDNHPADIGSEVFERGKDLALRESDSLHLDEIDEALERMEDGTYGSCLHCGAEIPYARLEAQPAARFCVECKEDAEAREISANRPVEENFLYPSFGRTFMDTDAEDQNGFDGEDSWQAVARFGTAATNDENPVAYKPDDYWTNSEEPIGYVQDIEGYLLADMYGNPVSESATPFVRNDAYKRSWEEAYADELTHSPDEEPDPSGLERPGE